MKNIFPLDVVLKIRRNEEGVQALKLAAIKERRRILLEQLYELRLAIDLQEKRRPEQSSAFELATGQKYSELLYKKGAMTLLEIQKADASEDVQRKILLAALMERKKIDRLRELWADKRAREQNKTEAREMDETARFQFSREEQ